MSTAAYVAMASAPISPEIQPAEDHRPETSIDDSLMGGLDGTEMYTTNVDEAGWQDEPVTSPIRASRTARSSTSLEVRFADRREDASSRKW